MGVSLVTNYYQEDVTAAEAMANTSSYAMSDMYYQPPGTLPPMVQPFDPTASKPLNRKTKAHKNAGVNADFRNKNNIFILADLDKEAAAKRDLVLEAMEEDTFSNDKLGTTQPLRYSDLTR